LTLLADRDAARVDDPAEVAQALVAAPAAGSVRLGGDELAELESTADVDTYEYSVLAFSLTMDGIR